MRPEMMIPEELTVEHPTPYGRELVQNLLSIVGVQLPALVLTRWTRMELIVAADWATREHYVAADYPKRLRREKPRFVVQAQAASSTHLGHRVRCTMTETNIAEGEMLGARSDGTIILKDDGGEIVYCWALLDFEVLPEPVRAGAR